MFIVKASNVILNFLTMENKKMKKNLKFHLF